MKGDFQTGRWRVEPELNQVASDGKTVHLEPKVMQVLVRLAERAGEVVSKQDLFSAVWPDTFVTDDVLTRAVSELRKALGDAGRPPQIIQTVPKRGYRLLMPVERVDHAEPLRSLAVLPFVNLNSDPDLEYLGDGIAGCLINLLTQLPQLSVPARSTVLRFKGREGSPREAGRE
ncbi:MAG: winged helix-turn-helix domain-containing protein, partial [Acidobacteria bacterium]|nr:winged helix-turn-helix domain-containing protein [Acidobacteriota bacterium]